MDRYRVAALGKTQAGKGGLPYICMKKEKDTREGKRIWVDGAKKKRTSVALDKKRHIRRKIGRPEGERPWKKSSINNQRVVVPETAI